MRFENASGGATTILHKMLQRVSLRLEKREWPSLPNIVL
jgi:hypothetical protein